MKDYRLSEIKEICEQQANCDNCEGLAFCEYLRHCRIPNEFDIEPRDMIDLPYKQRIDSNGTCFVYYRDEEGAVMPMFFGAGEEPEADAFVESERRKGDAQ